MPTPVLVANYGCWSPIMAFFTAEPAYSPIPLHETNNVFFVVTFTVATCHLCSGLSVEIQLKAISIFCFNSFLYNHTYTMYP